MPFSLQIREQEEFTLSAFRGHGIKFAIFCVCTSNLWRNGTKFPLFVRHKSQELMHIQYLSGSSLQMPR